jgi:glucose/arabinose dehydrogenase
LLAVGVAVLACALVVSLARGPRADAGQELRLLPVGNFDTPVYVDNAPGFKKLLFVVEQPGTIAVLRGGNELSHKFLRIRDRVRWGEVPADEQGLLSVAFAPNYERSRRFYVYYTNNDGDNQIDEFKRSRHSATGAAERTRRTVLVIPHPQHRNHNGGQLQFGPDSNLYVATGDGGGANDVEDNARDLESLNGKLLRIDPRRKGALPYTVPRGNPYVAEPGLDEIYSYGLRNPWRFSFDSASGNIAIGDVGQMNVEEVDYETRASAKGANFGWPEFEGDVPFDPLRPGPDPPEAPIFTYSSASLSGNCAVTGGYVVHDPGLPTLAGRYLYADFCGWDVHSFVPNLDGATDDQDTGLDVPNPSSFGEGRRGRIYVMSLGGRVFRIRSGG